MHKNFSAVYGASVMDDGQDGYGMPIVITASASRAAMPQMAKLLVGRVDPTTVSPHRKTYAFYQSALVAWSWVKANEAILDRFLGRSRIVMPDRSLAELDMTITFLPVGASQTGASAAAAMATAAVAYLWGFHVTDERAVTGAMDLRVRQTTPCR